MTFTYAPRRGTPVLVAVGRQSLPATVLREAGHTGGVALVDVTFVDGSVAPVAADQLRHHAPPTANVDDEVRRLSLLAVPEDVARPLITYIDALNAKAAERSDAQGYGFRSFYGVDVAATGGGKFLRIVASDDPQQTQGRSVHSFVVKATGEVVKPAGWNTPAKSTAKATKGKLMSKYGLTTNLDQLLADLDPYGSYLYA